jgi:tRNA pseudouridine38-40 synthase
VTLFDLDDYRRAALNGPLVRVRLTLAYDGTSFHGFADQPGLPTVAGRLAAGLQQVLGHPVDLVAAGRTDRGVHAWGQVVSFDGAAPIFDRLGAETVQRRLNKLCGPELVVRELAAAEPTFSARFSAVSRRYRYTIINRSAPDPFRRAYAWWIPEPLSVRAMQTAADALIGEHDFSSFCRRPKGVGAVGTPAAGAAAPGAEISLVRRVLEAEWSEPEPGELRFEIEAGAFCHQMVRALVGTLVAMGGGHRRPGEMLAILRAGDRSAAANVAPPHGLCLWLVRYEAVC